MNSQMKRDIGEVWEGPMPRNCPCGVGMHHSLCADVFTHLKPEPHTTEIFMEASSHKRGQLLTTFPAPLLFLEHSR